jgi:hypothetical protein
MNHRKCSAAGQRARGIFWQGSVARQFIKVKSDSRSPDACALRGSLRMGQFPSVPVLEIQRLGILNGRVVVISRLAAQPNDQGMGCRSRGGMAARSWSAGNGIFHMSPPRRLILDMLEPETLSPPLCISTESENKTKLIFSRSPRLCLRIFGFFSILMIQAAAIPRKS